jgi:cysteine desulfurase
VNVSIPQVSATALEHALDLQGVFVSRTAACRQRIEDHSPVVLAAYPDEPWRATNSIRWSLGWSTTSDDVDRALCSARAALAQLGCDPGALSTPSPPLSGTLPPLPPAPIPAREDD